MRAEVLEDYTTSDIIDDVKKTQRIIFNIYAIYESLQREIEQLKDEVRKLKEGQNERLQAERAEGEQSDESGDMAL